MQTVRTSRQVESRRLLAWAPLPEVGHLLVPFHDLLAKNRLDGRPDMVDLYSHHELMKVRKFLVLLPWSESLRSDFTVACRVTEFVTVRVCVTCRSWRPTHLRAHGMAPRRSQQKAASSKPSLVKLDAAVPGSGPKRLDPLTAVLPYSLN